MMGQWTATVLHSAGAELEKAVRSNPIILIWIVSLLAALVAYVFGANYTLVAAWALVVYAAQWVDMQLSLLPNLAASFIPALAIGAFVAFVPLTILSIRAGNRGRLALVLVSSVFLLLAGRDASRKEWLEALLVAGFGALVMTRRLRNRASVTLRAG